MTMRIWILMIMIIAGVSVLQITLNKLHHLAENHRLREKDTEEITRRLIPKMELVMIQFLWKIKN